MKKTKVSVVELFSGCGMQFRGLENTDCFDPVNVATCENNIDAIIAYAAIHCGLTPELINTYADYPSREQMAKELADKNIGYNFLKDKPYDWNKVARSKDSKQLLQKVWLADKLSKNLGDITKIQTLPHCGLMTFSFPCQSLSVSGKQEGMGEGETRSGLVWEVIRILRNMDDRPNFLIMENVDALVNRKFLPSYEKLNLEFAELGYDVKWQVLNSKFCGIPQNRRRVFGVYYLKDKVNLDNFEFPKSFDKGLRLEDALENEDEIEDKYYIKSDKARRLIELLVVEGKVTPEDFDKKKE